MNRKTKGDEGTTDEAATVTESLPVADSTPPPLPPSYQARTATPPPSAEKQVSVEEWAQGLVERRELSRQMAYAFVLHHPTHTGTPSDLAAALQAFRTRPIGD